MRDTYGVEIEDDNDTVLVLAVTVAVDSFSARHRLTRRVAGNLVSCRRMAGMDNGERRAIHIDDVPWEDFTDPLEPERAIGPLVRYLVDPDSGNRVMHIRSWPERGKAARALAPLRHGLHRDQGRVHRRR